MLWTLCFQAVLLLGFFAGAQNIDEILSYECARGVASLLEPSLQPGPVFLRANLVFASVETLDGGRVLIANAGNGTYAIGLAHAGVNRIRFELPSNRSTREETYFLSYLHDSAYRSRVFEFSVQRAPMGKDDLDYAWVKPQRAAHLRAHLEYGIWQTSEATLNALSDGAIHRSDLSVRHADCGYLVRQAPTLARGVRRNLDQLEMFAEVPESREGGRMPASLPVSAPVRTPAATSAGGSGAVPVPSSSARPLRLPSKFASVNH